MALSDDDDNNEEKEEVYDVERILAERLKDDIIQYLVKWQGYPDEQCTWEPAENFDTSETLATWTKQKDIGDVLEADDLQRIQRQMDAYQATLSSMSETEDSHHTSEGESDIEFDQSQPPKKRARMVYDPPPLSNRIRNAKGSGHERRVSTSNMKSSSTRSPVDRVKTTKPNSTRVREPGTTTFAPRTTKATRAAVLPARDSEDNVPPRSRPRLAAVASQSTFYAPDLNSRKPRTESKPKPRRHPTNMPFKNLRHQNNALKKQADKYYVDVTPAVPHTSSKTGDNDAQTITTTQPPEPEPNDSWLFFSEDEMEDDEQEHAHRQTNNQRQRRHTLQSVARKHNDRSDEQVKVKVEARLQGSPDHMVIPLTSIKHTDEVLMSSAPEVPPKLPVREERSPEPQETQSIVQSKSIQRSRDDTTKGVNAPRRALTTRPNVSSASAEHDQAFVSIRGETTQSTSRSKHTAPTHINNNRDQVDITHENDSRESSLPRPSTHDRAQNISQTNVPLTSLPASNSHRSDLLPQLKTQHVDRHTPYTDTVTPTPITQQFTTTRDAVRVATGRQWIKGDLVIELFLTRYLAGGIKIENFTWEQRAPIIQLKPKNEHTLPLYFDNVVTYDEYRSITASSTWWSIFGAGAVEAFPDSETTVSLAANYLEKNDVAAYWMHPHEETDLMLLLYSCRSPSWQYLYPPKPARSGETRLQMICHNKFRMQQSATIQGQSITTPHATAATDGGGYNQRHRRTSIVSNSSVNLHDEVPKSPGEQLTRGMAEHNLNTRSRRDSDAHGNDDTRESIVMLTSKDPRAARIIQPASPEADTDTSIKSVLTQLNSTYAELTHFEKSGQLDRDVKQLSKLATLASSHIDQSDVWILLVHQPQYSLLASNIQKWLSAQTTGTQYVLTESTSTGLNDQDHKSWVKFRSHLQNGVCVLLCDSLHVASRTGDFAKLLEQDNMVCWKIDLGNEHILPLETVRLFPTGIAMALTQQCFLVEPKSSMYLLRWFRHRAEKPYSASRLILPPNITAMIHEQALLSIRPETKQCFLELMSLIQGLTRLSVRQEDDDLGFGFHLLLPKWEEVYTDMTPTTTGLITTVEQKDRDEAMSDAFNKYFGAWAILNATRHRRFIGVLTTTKPKYYEHVRWTGCKDGAIRLGMKEKIRNEARSRSRGRSGEHSRANSTDGAPREQSNGR